MEWAWPVSCISDWECDEGGLESSGGDEEMSFMASKVSPRGRFKVCGVEGRDDNMLLGKSVNGELGSIFDTGCKLLGQCLITRKRSQ